MPLLDEFFRTIRERRPLLQEIQAASMGPKRTRVLGCCIEEQDRERKCVDVNAISRSLKCRNLEVEAGEEITMIFDECEYSLGRESGIAYRRGVFCLPEAGLYHFDLAVCFVADFTPESEASVSVGAVPLHGGFAEMRSYGQLVSSGSGATSAASNRTLLLSGDIYVCAQQLLCFVASLKKGSECRVKIRASDFNPPHAAKCTFVSIRQLCDLC